MDAGLQDATACSGGGSGPGHPPTEATYGDDGPRRDHPQVLLPCALLMLAVTFGCGVYKFAHKLMTGCGDQLWLGITQVSSALEYGHPYWLRQS
jgi:hypothetical protein